MNGNTMTVYAGSPVVTVDEGGFVVGVQFTGPSREVRIENPGSLLNEARARIEAKAQPIEAMPHVFEHVEEEAAYNDALMDGHSDETYFSGLAGLPWNLAYDA